MSGVWTAGLLAALSGGLIGANMLDSPSASGALVALLVLLGSLAGHGAARLARTTLTAEEAMLLGLALLLHLAGALPRMAEADPAWGLALALPLAVLGLRDAARNGGAEPGARLLLVGAFAFALAWTVGTRARFASFAEDGVLRLWLDMILHAHSVAELGAPVARGQGAMSLAGVDPGLYHFAGFALPALAVRLIGVDPLSAVAGVWLPMGMALMALGLVALGRALGGVATAGLALLLLAAWPEGLGFAPWHGFLSLHWLLETAPGTGYGCALALLSAALLVRHAREGGCGLLALSLLALALTFLLRAHVFVWFAPVWAVGAALASPLVPRRLRVPLAVATPLLLAQALVLLAWPEIAAQGLGTHAARYIASLLAMTEGSALHVIAGALAPWLPDWLLVLTLSLAAAIAPAPALFGALALLALGMARGGRLRGDDATPFAAVAVATLLMLLAFTPGNGDALEWRQRGFPLVVLLALAWVARFALALLPVPVPARLLAGAAGLSALLTWQGAEGWKAPRLEWAHAFRAHAVPEPAREAAAFLRRAAQAGERFAILPMEPDATLVDRASEISALSAVPAWLARAGIHRRMGASRADVARERMARLEARAGEPMPSLLAWLRAERVAYLVVLGPAASAGAVPAFAAPGVMVFRTETAPPPLPDADATRRAPM